MVDEVKTLRFIETLIAFHFSHYFNIPRCRRILKYFTLFTICIFQTQNRMTAVTQRHISAPPAWTGMCSSRPPAALWSETILHQAWKTPAHQHGLVCVAPSPQRHSNQRQLLHQAWQTPAHQQGLVCVAPGPQRRWSETTHPPSLTNPTVMLHSAW